MLYKEVRFKVNPFNPGVQILIAQLGEIGFESFIEEQDELKAYITAEAFSEHSIKTCQIYNNPEFNVRYSIHDIEDINWNQTWENNFKPVKISEDCVIRATFHKPFNVKHELIIEPKMSFGTGHHATTHLMLEELLEEDLKDKTVLDMGCGTGVLSILAEKLGAQEILAIDKDEWCFINTLENKERNSCSKITVKQGSQEQIKGTFDVVLANINRNILLEQLPLYNKHLNKNAKVFISGFYHSDLESLSTLCGDLGLKYVKHKLKNNWVCAKYIKL